MATAPPPPPPPPPSFDPHLPSNNPGQTPGTNATPNARSNRFIPPQTKLDLTVSCISLHSLDGIPPPTFAVLYLCTTGKTPWAEISRSETVPRSYDPVYKRLFHVEYRFELYQQLRIVIFERCIPGDNLRGQTMIGAVDTTLAEVVAAGEKGCELNLVNVARGADVGRVIVKGDEIMSARKRVTLGISVSRLMRPEIADAQRAYIDSLRQRADMPVIVPQLPKRGVAAVGNMVRQRFRKEPHVPAVLPAHMANTVHVETRERESVRQEIENVVTAPPPFVPFLSIMRAPADAMARHDIRSESIQWTEVYKSMGISEYQDLETGLKLDEFTVSEYDLTEGDDGRLLKIAMVQSGGTGGGTIIGEHIMTFPALRKACMNIRDHPVELNLEPIGLLHLSKFHEETEPSFIDYVKSGQCDFGLVTAIDFTASNGDPRRTGTRHFHAPGGVNEYEAAMRAVGNMLACYSSDRRIPAYGFGANLPPKYEVSHCFPVTESQMGDPFCKGVEGLVRAYKQTVGRIQLYGPTIFSEVLRTVGVVVSRRAEAAEKAGKGSMAYTVLLILTDGVISDFDATVAELIKLSYLPLSVVIVGVGGEDFGKMHKLDCGGRQLRRGAEFAIRGNVQFVSFREYGGDLSELAERVLGGIPEQVMSYVEKVRGGELGGLR